MEIESVVSDSRQAGPGALFVAIRGGQELDRHAFIGDAVARGAAAVVVEEAEEGLPETRIQVDDCRQALPALSARLHGHPARSLRWCVGVTGTNGKSTTALLVRHVLEAAGARSGYIGTLGFAFGEKMESLDNTTPEADQLQALLARARDAGCDALVMEVSSHGLALRRVDGIDYSAAVFTNLTRDHLDFHGTEEAYLEAKTGLFRRLDPRAAAVVNADDPRAEGVAASTSARVLTYGEKGEHVRLASFHSRGRASVLRLETAAGEWSVETTLTGRFNRSNVMAAACVGVALGIDAAAVRSGIAALSQVPGRFERLDEGQPFEVIVDYAHTPAGLDTVLRTARELTRGRLLCLFGCGGDRDRGKRPLMGRVAEDLADLVFLTSDNPRSESPEEIIDEIAAGMRDAGSAVVCADRRAAIEAALQEAGEGDVVVVAGKGDEPYQILAEGPTDFDDRRVVRQVLRG
jgi:UDP-N-acetylmuramoyl-L-alanyl-D-glutamate--2,6-diaminopimelate ligase